MSQAQITQFNLPPGMIDLGMGDPDLELLPVGAIQKSAQSYFHSGDPRPLQYGLEQGNGLFRRSLADFLAAEHGFPIDPEQLFVTAGASSALDLICTLYTSPGDTIFVEEPTYFLALKIFRDHGLQVVSVPVDEDGMLIEALDDKLAESSPRFFYTIPVFQNPTGVTLSKGRREQLVERAKQHNFLVVADEVYQLLHYDQKPPRPLAYFAGEVEQVISINSFSKILAPGLRLGWIQAHPQVIERLIGCGLLDSGGGMNPFVSVLLLDLIESGGLKNNVEVLRRAYAKRVEAMDAALQAHLPSAKYVRPHGGFFFWARLPEVDTVELRQQALEFSVGFRPGVLFSSPENHGRMKEFIRLSYCYYKSDEITEGIRRIADVLNAI